MQGNFWRQLSLGSFILGICTIVCASDLELSISIGTKDGYPKVNLENSVFSAEIYGADNGAGGIEHAIRKWTIKSQNEELVGDSSGKYVDACAFRLEMTSATVTDDSADKKTVRCVYRNSGSGTSTTDYTIFANSPVIKVDYVEYSGSWNNTVDLFSLGSGTGTSWRYYGDDTYLRTIAGSFYDASYWNTVDGGVYANDPADGGALNYQNHFIGAVARTSTGCGIARISPVFADNTRGGARILKNLNFSSASQGFETFPGTGQSYRPAYTGYLLIFDDGVDQAIASAQQIVDSNSGPVQTDFTFDPIVIDLPSQSDWVRVGDIDNDGDLDLASGYLCFFENDGTGRNWTRKDLNVTGVSNTIPGGTVTWDSNGAFLHDVDEDGDLDLIKPENSFGNPGWLENPGDGSQRTVANGETWQWRQLASGFDTGGSAHHKGGWFTHDMERYDLDGDGKAEEFVMVFHAAYINDEYRVNWFRPNADPTQAWENNVIQSDIQLAGHNQAGISCSETPFSAADMDGDGDLDFSCAVGWMENPGGDARGTWNYHQIAPDPIVNGDGKPRISPYIQQGLYMGVSNNVLGDMDGDGDIDSIMSWGHHGYGLHFMENKGGDPRLQSNWEAHVIDADLLCPEGLQIADLDNDGNLDIVVCDLNFSDDNIAGTWTDDIHSVYVFENLGGANFRKQTVYTGNPLHSLRLYDINQDGKLDIIADGNEDKTLTILENTTGGGTQPPPPQNVSPVASAGLDQTLVDQGNDGNETVSLDASASNDPDGVIVFYSWRQDGVEIATGATPVVALGVGANDIELTVTDDGGATATDNVLITVNVAPPVVGANLLQNPGFELDGDSWGGVPASGRNVVSTNLHSGSKSLAMTFDTILTRIVDQVVTGIEGGTEYDVSAWIKTVGADDGNGRIQIKWRDAAFVSLREDFPGNVSGTSDWTQKSARLTAPTGATNVIVMLVGRCSTATIYFDDLEFKAVTAPVNNPPVADAGVDQVLTDTDNNGSENVVLDASGSSDPDGNIVNYSWLENSTEIASGVNPTLSLTVGTHDIELKVIDDDGAEATAQMQVIINSGQSSGGGGGGIIPADYLAYWKLDEGSGTLAADLSSNGLNGNLVGGPAWITGQVNGALQFDGVDDYVNVPGYQHPVNNKLSFALWFKADALDAGVWYHAIDMPGRPARIRFQGNTLRFTVAGINLDQPGINTGQWYHVAGTWDGIVQKLYVDGVEVGSIDNANTIATPSGNLRLGYQAIGAPLPFAGALDEVLVYSRALTAAEVDGIVNGEAPPVNNPPVAVDGVAVTNEDVAVDITLTASDPDGDIIAYMIEVSPQHGILSSDDGDELLTYTPDPGYSGTDSFTFKVNDGQEDSNIATLSVTINPQATQDVTADLIAHYKLDEGAGNMAADASGMGNDATVINGPAWVNGHINGGLQFDGVDDYLEVNDFDYAGGEISIALWIYQDQLTAQHMSYVSLPNDTIRLKNAFQAQTEFRAGVKINRNAMAAGRWIHLVGVADGNEVKLYVDGVLLDSVPGTVIDPLQGRLRIGAASWGTPNCLTGTLDDIRIYDRALTDEEITILSSQ